MGRNSISLFKLCREQRERAYFNKLGNCLSASTIVHQLEVPPLYFCSCHTNRIIISVPTFLFRVMHGQRVKSKFIVPKCMYTQYVLCMKIGGKRRSILKVSVLDILHSCMCASLPTCIIAILSQYQ